MNLEIGHKIRWECAEGVMRGTIKNIVLAPNANGVIVPWIDVQCGFDSSIRLSATAPSLMMFQVALVA